MRKILNSVLCISLVTILSSCVKKQILDDINMVDGIGFDLAENGEISGTVVFPIYLPDQPPKNQAYTAHSSMKRSILQDIQRQSADPIVTGSFELVLFGKELATEEGILEMVDAIQRDPGVGSGLYLAVVDGQTKKLLEGDYGITSTATHISNMIEHNIKIEDLPKTNLQLFLFDFYQDGKTPYMPQIRQNSKSKVEVTDLSLFKHGKIVDFVPAEKMFFFKLLVDKYSEGLHRIKIEDGEAAVRSIRSSHHFKLMNRNPIEILVSIKVEGIINEFTGNTLSAKKIAEIKKGLEKEINQECLKLISSFQKKELDPIGFGQFVKTQIRNFDMKRWQDTGINNYIVKVDSNVTITEAGVIE